MFQNPLLKNERVIEELKSFLVDSTAANSSNDIAATGIPSHVMLLGKMRRLESAIEKQQGDNDVLVDRVVAGVTKVLEERAVESGVPTCDRLATTVIQRLQAAGFAHCRVAQQEHLPVKPTSA